jgi:hypothetical protein
MNSKYIELVDNVYSSILEEKNNISVLNDFIKIRAKGAQKLEKQTREKGGASILTAIHYKAKEIPYEHCLENSDDLKSIEKKADGVFNKLKNWKNLSQRQFQTLMGELEAYGEIYIKIKKPNSININ